MIRRRLSGLAFWFPGAGGVGGQRATGEQPDATLIASALSPSLGDQDFRILPR